MIDALSIVYMFITLFSLILSTIVYCQVKDDHGSHITDLIEYGFAIAISCVPLVNIMLVNEYIKQIHSDDY